jgi:hypothetical protein
VIGAAGDGHLDIGPHPVADHPLAVTLVQTGCAYYSETAFNREGETVLENFDLTVAVEPLKRLRSLLF